MAQAAVTVLPRASASRNGPRQPTPPVSAYFGSVPSPGRPAASAPFTRRRTNSDALTPAPAADARNASRSAKSKRISTRTERAAIEAAYARPRRHRPPRPYIRPVRLIPVDPEHRRFLGAEEKPRGRRPPRRGIYTAALTDRGLDQPGILKTRGSCRALLTPVPTNRNKTGTPKTPKPLMKPRRLPTQQAVPRGNRQLRDALNPGLPAEAAMLARCSHGPKSHRRDSPPDTQKRHLGSPFSDGRTWDRTRDLSRVKRALSR